MNKCRKSGFTLVEVLIVVVIMAVLAATIIPQFSDSAKDAKSSSVKFNLHTLRSQVQLYKGQHGGKVPTATLVELTSKTDETGAAGTKYGPYIAEIPMNPFTNSNTVKASTAASKSSDVDTTSGWLYDAATGDVWINHAEFINE